jgi:hypothetical protein
MTPGASLICFFCLAASALGESTAGAPLSSGRWVAFSRQPATGWEDSFVTGNGRHGTMPCGVPGAERVIQVHEELFLRAYDRHVEVVPDIAKLMPEVRKLCGEGKMQAAANLACAEARKQLDAKGVPGSDVVCPHPAFDLNLRTTPVGKVADYRRELDMETGESNITWRDDAGGYEQTVFSSRTANVNVVRLRSTGGKKLTCDLSLAETPGRQGKANHIDLATAIGAPSTAAEPGWLTYQVEYGFYNGGYTGEARVTTKGGKVTGDGKMLHVAEADEILIVTRITPYAEKPPVREAVRKELKALSSDYAALLAPHARKHGEMFRRVALDMDQADAWKTTPTETMLAEIHAKGPTPLFYEQMHAMGRYMLISSCGKYPPPLQGIWGGSWKPKWLGGFVLDSNLNLAICNMSIGSLPECAETYFGYVERALPGWRKNAKGYLGCRGFLVPHYADPDTNYLVHFMPQFPWMFWAAGAGWNIMPLYEHAMITGDMDLLKKRVLPLYREMADFYQDWLIEGPDGKLHSMPSISPENFVKGSLLSRDPTMDVAVAREVFSHLVTMGKLFKLDEKDIAKWQSMRDRLPAYRINKDGALAEWCDPAFPDRYAHRHSSHLYPVFPGTEFLQQGTDPALVKATQIALDKRFASDTDSAHGLVHVALMAARLHDPDKIGVNLERFSKRNYVYTGLSTSHNPNHAIYNLDSVLSLPRLMAEMVVFSQPGRLELLPALPATHPAGKLTGICIHGGHTLDVEWKDGKLVSATLHAGKDGSIEVVSGGGKRALALMAGKHYSL